MPFINNVHLITIESWTGISAGIIAGIENHSSEGLEELCRNLQ